MNCRVHYYYLYFSCTNLIALLILKFFIMITLEQLEQYQIENPQLIIGGFIGTTDGEI